ncbi:MAG TPA: site-2 protease family protein [Candidatus Coproplasma avicola]|uniref:Site-2 protease family protein n=1 Tax=Candidatus Coproplasma avicola TaxID=2840744 RepID=A0A9D1J925_9FIRM|nr:site-2 protease family protein [Candidatus Coproplasma avicola]
MDLFYFLQILAGIVAVIFVLCPHEWAHAYVATKCGDGTPKAYGRLTLNPIKHLDPVGFICCAIVGFGWAKPVPINPYNFKNYRKGLFMTAVAGVVVNYLIAFFAFLIFTLLNHFVFNDVILISEGAIYYSVHDALGYLGFFVCLIFYLIYAYSLSVFVFNLLPLYPLDGFRVVESFTRQVNPVRRFLREYGQVILIILVVESFICDLMVRYGVSWAEYADILGYILYFATDIIGYPIQAAWGWIAGI